MNQLKYFIVLVCFTLLLFNCTQTNELTPPIEKVKQKYSIPDSIIHKSNMIIISKVGQTFFDSYIKLDSNKSNYYPPDTFCIKHPASCADYLVKPSYLMSYKFSFLNNKDYNTLIEFVVDANGTVVSGLSDFGVPSCPNNDCWNNFHVITKEKAIEIAKQNGLEVGLKDWVISFHFYSGTLNNYVWDISNTLKIDNPIAMQYSASGRTFLINAIDGSVFKILGWTVKSYK